MAQEDLILADNGNQDSIILNDLPIGLVTHETAFSSDYDGIIGLSYPALAQKDVQTFFDTLMSDGLLKLNAFSFFLSSHKGESSELILGGWDE